MCTLSKIFGIIGALLGLYMGITVKEVWATIYYTLFCSGAGVALGWSLRKWFFRNMGI